jgi:DNA-binding protein YbaB
VSERVFDPDAARERVAAWKGRIDKLAADTQAMSDRLQQVRISAADPGGLAEVTVDSTGALVGLRLTDRIQRTAPDVVAQASLVRQARGQAAQRSQEVITETMGQDSAAGRAIAEQVGQHLRAAPAAEDEDFGGQSFLRRQ